MDELQRLVAEGEAVPGTGHFSLDPARLRQSMVELNQIQPCGFLVKLMQFAFAAGPRRLEVDLSAELLALRFRVGNVEAGSLSAAAGSLHSESPLHPLTRRFRHLRQALALLLARPDLELFLEEGEEQLRAVGGKTRCRSCRPARYTRVELRPVRGERRLAKCTLASFEIFSPLVSRQWPEWTLVKQYIAAPPCVVVCNGELWTPSRKAELVGWQDSLMLERPQALSFCWATGRAGEGELPVDIPGAPQPEWGLTWTDSVGARGQRFLFRLSRGDQGETPRDFYFVQDGFIIDTMTRPDSLYPLEGWIDGAELLTDASGLRAVRNPTWEGLAEGAIHAARRFLHHCAAEFPPARVPLSQRLVARGRASELKAWALRHPLEAEEPD